MMRVGLIADLFTKVKQWWGIQKSKVKIQRGKRQVVLVPGRMGNPILVKPALYYN